MTTFEERSDVDHRVAFISGPLEVTKAYFDRYYRPLIDEAISQGHHFVIGPVGGIDALALEYLIESGVPPSRFRVYMASFEIASRVKFVQEMRDLHSAEVIVEARREDGSDALTTWDRDAAMTRASDYDILRFRTERETKSIYGDRWRARVSNTERNWRRRKGQEGCEEEVVPYIAHVDVWEDRKFRAIRTMIKRKTEDRAKLCDGLCDAHRDTIKEPLLSGSIAFGVGSDGQRLY